MIAKNKNLKIALIGDSLDNGGAEKVHALLSNYFFSQNFEVYNVIFLDKISYNYSGQLLNLGLITNRLSLFQKGNRFFKLIAYFNENNFDITIDFRMRTSAIQEFLLAKFIFPKNTFYTIHSAILEYYLPSNPFAARIIYNSKNMVSVSKAMNSVIVEKYNFDSLVQLYNPINLTAIEVLKNEFQVSETNYVLAVGRMNDTIKQFDKLILAYSKSVLPAKGIKLLFLGDGNNKSDLIALANQLQLEEMIVFKNFVDNPFPYYKNAFFTILSSKNEGFPNVLIESLASETPVISFDCFSGPNEIIDHHKNGLLVANQDFEALTNAMNEMLQNEALYAICKKNSKESVLQFDIEKIGNQWKELFKNIVS